MRDATRAGRTHLWASQLAVTVLAVAALSACASSRAGGGAAEAPLPESPAATVRLAAPAAPATVAPSPVPEALLHGETQVDLAMVVDLALANSPLTRASWLQARSAAAQLGSERADYWPSVDLTADATRSSVASANENVQPGTNWGPTVAVDFLLFDLSRAARVEEARQMLLATDWSHNATVQGVVLTTLQAYYGYQNIRGQRDAAASSMKTAQVVLEAATLRREAGLATRAEVLLATTASSRAQLAFEALDGEYAAARGALATALGLPASTPLDVGPLPAEVPIDAVAGAVERLVAGALAARPDLAATRVEAEKARVHIVSVRGEGWPTMSLSGSTGRRWFNSAGDTAQADTWSAGFYLRFPLFTGWAQSYDLERARADAAVAEARTTALEQQIGLEVWTAYYALHTAGQRVRTSRDLLASATESEEVALARYREGVGTLLDLVVSQSVLADARAQEVAARADFLSALAALGYATGRLDSAGVREFAPATAVVAPPAAADEKPQER